MGKHRGGLNTSPGRARSGKSEEPPKCRDGGNSTTTHERCNNSAQMTYEHWLDSTATIKSCDWDDSPAQSPSSLFTGHFTVAFSYTVGGIRYSGKFYSAYEWEKEKEVTILYNPQNPVESCVCDEDESPITQAVQCVLELAGGLLSEGL